MKKFLAAVLLSTVVFTSCGGHNASPIIPGGAQQTSPGTNDANGVPRGSDAAAVANAGPYGFAETYSAQLYSAGQTPANQSAAKAGIRHPLTISTATPSPSPTCPPGEIGTPPACTFPGGCPPICGGCPPACATPTPPPTPTPAPTLPPVPGTQYNLQTPSDCLVGPQALVQQNGGASSVSPAFSIGSGYGRVIRTNTKTTNIITANSYVASVNVLSSLITADYVSATAGATVQEPSGSTTFRNLKVNGQTVTVTGQPNQQVTINNVGYVVLNEQQTGGAPLPFGFLGIAQTAGIHLYITDPSNPYGLAQGYDIIVGMAVAGIAAPFDGAFPTVQAYGFGKGTTLIDNIADNCGSVGISGGSDEQTYPSYPLGTDGSVNGMDTWYQVDEGGGPGPLARASKHPLFRALPAPRQSGTRTIWNRDLSIFFGGTVTQAGTWLDSATLGSDINAQGVDIETGVIDAPGFSATGIATQAYVQVDSLTIGGKTYSNTRLPSNLRVNIPNLGYAILAQTVNTSTGSGPYVADVIGIHLYVTVRNNTHGLAVGDYIIGRAHSDIAVMPGLLNII